MILFRTDASSASGIGRLLRGIAIAQQLRSKTPFVFVIGEDGPGHKLLSRLRLPVATDMKFAADPAVKLLIHDSARGEGDPVLDACRKLRIPILQFRESAAEPDLGGWLIDLALPPPPDPERGLDWAPLHPRFRHFHPQPRLLRQKPIRLLLFLGRAPDYRRVREILDTLCRHSFRVKVAADFLLKKSHKKVLKRIYPSLCFVGRVECLARALFEADAALVTPGTIALEAATVGTPALYLFRNEAQRQAAAWLQEKGAGRTLGPLADATEEQIVSALKSLDLDSREKMASAGKALSDGRGLFRILSLLKKEQLLG